MSFPGYRPKRIVILDIGSLRLDVFQTALAGGKIPHIARLLGGPNTVNGILFEAVSTAPSSTYCCQASSFTGAHPCDHWIPGDDYFDRFGRLSSGAPRRLAFGGKDALDAFHESLASHSLNPRVATLYETAASRGWRSCVAYNMYARGAQYWLKPDLSSFQGPRDLDAGMVEAVLALLRSGESPELVTLYFSGLERISPVSGLEAQLPYLAQVVDPLVGHFVESWAQLGLGADTLYALFSDHGQVSLPGDDAHTLRLGSMLRRNETYEVNPLGQELPERLFEGPECDALFCPNGGMAHIYIRKESGAWREAPRFQEDILPAAGYLWRASQDGANCPELKGSLDMVLVRDCELEGWQAEYQAFTPDGLFSIPQFLADNHILAIDAHARLHSLSSPLAGDILLFARGASGYAFASQPAQVSQGGLQPGESRVVQAYALPGAGPEDILHVRQIVFSAAHERSRSEGRRQVGSVDVAYVLRAVMGW